MKTSDGVVIVDRYAARYARLRDNHREASEREKNLIEEISRLETPVTPQEYVRAACSVMMEEDSSKNEKIPEYPAPATICEALIKRRAEGKV